MRGAPAAALALLLPAAAAGLRAAGRTRAEAAEASAHAEFGSRSPIGISGGADVALNASSGGPPHPILINVGLVGTATRSLTHALRALGLRAAHVGPCNVPYDLENVGSNMSRFLDSRDAFSDIPFNGAGFIKVAVAYAAKYPEKVKLVATVRDKLAWIGSMLRNPGNGGCFIRLSYGIQCDHATTPSDLSAMYDSHVGLLLQHNITLLPMGQWGLLCEALHNFPPEILEACRHEKLRSAGDGLPRASNFESPRDGDAGPCADHGWGSGY